MTCDDCPFHPTQGGTCSGLIKNPAAKVPFYICPREEDLQKLRDYELRAVQKRAERFVPSVSLTHHIESALVSGPGLVSG